MSWNYRLDTPMMQLAEEVTDIKDSKKCILTKEACEELIKRLCVINIKEDEQAKNDRVDSHL